MRGARLDDLRRAVVSPPFAGTDVLLLSEVDVGVGRSGNRNVARELAEVLGMSYAFGVSYLALTDDIGDDAAGLENTLALSGAAVLSRYPIGRVENIDLPAIKDKFHSSEKRLGKKRALLAEIALPDGPLAVAGLPPRLDRLARAARAPARWVLGQRRSQRRGARAGGRRFQHQHLRRLEHAGAGARHLPQAAGHGVPRLHRSVHDAGQALRAAGVRVSCGRATSSSTASTIAAPAPTSTTSRILTSSTACTRMVGRALTRFLGRLMRPWNGCVPARLDWFAGRNVTPVAAAVERPRAAADGRPISDHSAVIVDVAV